MSIKDDIDNSVDLENRSPQSTRLFIKIAFFASVTVLVLFFVSVISYQIRPILGLNIFSAVFIPMVILCLISFYLSVAERLRAKYLGARIAVILSCIAMLSIAAFLLFEFLREGEIFIAPFNPPPRI